MDVSAPITAAVPGVAGLVIAALLPTIEPLTGAQVAAACPAASEMGVRKSLGRLVDSGVALKVPGGYVLNREHLVFPALELLDGLYGTLRRRIRAAVVEWGGDVTVVGLFGSAARRDGDAESDIDVLFVSDDAESEDFALALGEQVKLWTGNECHVMTVTSQEIRRMKRLREPIVGDWARDLDPVIGSMADALDGPRRTRS